MLLNIVEGISDQIFYSLCIAAVLLVLIIILVCCSLGGKKKKSNESKEENSEEIPDVEETVEETPDVEETVEEIPDVEETVEETPDVEETVEETPVVEETKRKVVGKYEVYRDGEHFRFTLKASNGEVLIESEMYTTKEGALHGIETIKNNVEIGEIIISKDKKDLYQFQLKAKNHRVLVTSANYSSERGAQNAVESFKRFASNANIIELEDAESNQTTEKFEITDVQVATGGKIKVLCDGGVYSFKVLASNNEVLGCGEGYKTKIGCTTAIENLKHAVVTGTFYVSKDKMGMFQYKLYSETNRLVLMGETYKTKAAAKSSATSLCSFIENAVLEIENAQ